MKGRKSYLIGHFTLFLFAAALVGCGSGSDTPKAADETQTHSFKTVLIDATAGGLGAPPTDPRNKYTYFNLSAGEVVDLTDEEAPTSSDWDIAFNRSSIKINSGISGAKGVVGYYTGNNTEAYESDGKTPKREWFEDDPGDPADFSATADTELSDFNSVDFSRIPDDSEFKADRLITAINSDGSNESWWLYNSETHTVASVPENWWVVRSAGGDSYVKFHVTGIERDSAAGVRKITIEWYYQGSTATVFDTALQSHLIEVPIGGGAKYLDFDTRMDSEDSSVLPGWDMKVEYDSTTREYRITLNGRLSGTGKAAAFGPTTTPDLFTTGTRGSGPGQVPLYFQDRTGGVFIDFPWYAYDITGNDNKLWPNYRVYLVKTGEDVYRLQILSYYHPQTTESGWYTIRYEKVVQ